MLTNWIGFGLDKGNIEFDGLFYTWIEYEDCQLIFDIQMKLEIENMHVAKIIECKPRKLYLECQNEIFNINIEKNQICKLLDNLEGIFEGEPWPLEVFEIDARTVLSENLIEDIKKFIKNIKE